MARRTEKDRLRMLVAGQRPKKLRKRLKKKLSAAAGQIELVAEDGDGAADLVVLPHADYRALMDRVEPAMRRQAAVQMAEAAAGGSNRIRLWRRHRNLSLQELARRIGRSKGYLSEIETGRKPGSLPVLRAVAAVLEVDLDDLLPAPRPNADA